MGIFIELHPIRFAVRSEIVETDVKEFWYQLSSSDDTDFDGSCFYDFAVAATY